MTQEENDDSIQEDGNIGYLVGNVDYGIGGAGRQFELEAKELQTRRNHIN
jgi:hypothetical protein